MNDFKVLDWLVMILNLYAYYLIGNKNKNGFIIGLIGCILGFIVFMYSFNLPMIIMYVMFGILNLKSYIKWKK